jgi:flagella basal body P-ring formation protein FlgA
MIPRMLLILLAAPAGAQPQACLQVAGDRILAGDMARAVPAFAGVAAEMVLGDAPGPGARRTYSAAELARLARRYGLALEPATAACFLRPMQTLTRESVAAALSAALPAARIEVLEFGRQPTPPGDLRFPLSGLRTDSPSGAALLWHGVVSASAHEDFPVWAKVRIQISGTQVTSTEPLAPGHTIARGQVREDPYQGPPGLPDLSQIVGRAPRRPIPAGTVIERQWLEAPADVQRGERVRVEIRSGRALVILEGQAQSSGRRGEVIGVRNPANGKILRATVTEPGRLVLVAGQSAGSADEGGNR